MTERLDEVMLAALKQAVMEPGEQRLYRAGKFSGLFPGRTGVSGQAAQRALQEGLLEIARTETRGKSEVEWVRATPRGIQYVYDRESPARVLEELRGLLRTNQDQVPIWLAEFRRDLQTLAKHLTDEAQRWTHNLQVLSRRVEEAVRRSEAGASPARNATADPVPWAIRALAYLDQRRDAGARDRCPLPELFSAIQEHDPELTISAFHDGLRRLRDRQALRLGPFTGQAHELGQPEYALPEGNELLYYAER